MRIFKTKAFARFARKAAIPDDVLCEAVRAAGQGAVAADLGGGVIKQRIARQGGGKSGGFRVLVLLRIGSIAFFVYGFAKNEQDNIRADESVALKKLALEMFAYNESMLMQASRSGALVEVSCDEQAVP